MKVFSLDTINIVRLYLISVVCILVFVFFLILIIFVIFNFFPFFKYVHILIIVSALIFGNVIFKISYKYSTKSINVILKETKIFFDTDVIEVEDIKGIYIRKSTNHYPEILFDLSNGQVKKFRIAKNIKDYLEFIKYIKKN